MEFLDNDGNKFRACVPSAGLKMESWLTHGRSFPLERKATRSRRTREELRRHCWKHQNWIRTDEISAVLRGRGKGSERRPFLLANMIEASPPSIISGVLRTSKGVSNERPCPKCRASWMIRRTKIVGRGEFVRGFI